MQNRETWFTPGFHCAVVEKKQVPARNAAVQHEKDEWRSDPSALCRRRAKLCRSHLFPAAAYRLLLRHAGTNPVLVTKAAARSTSEQLAAYLLCPNCEQRFSAAERLPLHVCYRGHRRFRLPDTITNIEPEWRRGSFQAIPTRGVARLNVVELVYFAASVFWRASIHHWRNEAPADLGAKYEQQFRHYLLASSELPTNSLGNSAFLVGKLYHPPVFWIARAAGNDGRLRADRAGARYGRLTGGAG